jgi:hypothetical protein
MTSQYLESTDREVAAAVLGIPGPLEALAAGKRTQDAAAAVGG